MMTPYMSICADDPLLRHGRRLVIAIPRNCAPSLYHFDESSGVAGSLVDRLDGLLVDSSQVEGLCHCATVSKAS